MFQGKKGRRTNLESTECFEKICMGGDLDELIECQSINSRALNYVSFEHDLNIAEFAPRSALRAPFCLRNP